MKDDAFRDAMAVSLPYFRQILTPEEKGCWFLRNGHKFPPKLRNTKFQKRLPFIITAVRFENLTAATNFQKRVSKKLEQGKIFKISA